MPNKKPQPGFALIPTIIVVIILIGSGFLFYYLNTPKTNTPDIRGITKLSTIINRSNNSTSEKPANLEEEGLVAYFSFDHEDEDYQINGAQFVAGIKNQALAFDGQDDFVEIKPSVMTEVGSLSNGTIGLWFKFTKDKPKQFLPMLYFGKDKSKTTSSNLVIEIGHYDHGAAPDTKLYYTLYDGNRFEPFLCFDSNLNLKQDTWYHFAVVSSSQGNTGYLNGQELTNRHYNFSHSQDNRFLSSIPIQDVYYLGYGWFGIDQKFHFFKGAIDELKIYNRALTSDEITALANVADSTAE